MAISCNSTTNKTEDIIPEKEFVMKISDTIKAIGFKDNASACLEITGKYHKNFGIIISDYYITLDSLSLDLNNDSKPDYILVLSPRSLEDEYNPCNGDKSPKRLLAEIIITKHGSKLRKIYSNLISDTGGVISHYNGISKKGNGFEITHEAGAKYSWLYKTGFIISKNQILLSKITKTCSVDGKGKTIELPFKNRMTEKINVPDSLNNDCNCDKIWKSLDSN